MACRMVGASHCQDVESRGRGRRADGGHGLQNIRSGNYPVITTNHTLVLNWNSQTVPLLRQIAINKVERNNSTYDGCEGGPAPLHVCIHLAFK